MIRLLKEKDAGHGGFLGYHFIVLLLGVFPASLLAIPAMRLGKKDISSQGSFQRWMFLLFWVVLLLFSVVRTKIMHYSSLCYFSITFFALLYFKQLLEKKRHFSVVLKVGLTFYCVYLGNDCDYLIFCRKI